MYHHGRRCGWGYKVADISEWLWHCQCEGNQVMSPPSRWQMELERSVVGWGTVGLVSPGTIDQDVTNVTLHVNTPQTTHWLSHSRTEPQVELSPNSIHESIRRGSDWVRWIRSGDSSVGTAGCWLWDWWCSGQVWQDMSCGALGEGDGSLLIFHPNLSFPMLHIVTGGVIAYEISGIIKQPPFVIDTFSGVQRQVICQLMVTKTPTAYDHWIIGVGYFIFILRFSTQLWIISTSLFAIDL